MRIAFLTEMGFEGKIPSTHPNMRTEFAWMYALDADHYNIRNIQNVKDYEHVFVIFPKGKLFLSAEGSKIQNGVNPISDLLQFPLVQTLKQNNSKVHYVQEGPHWWWNDYEISEQIGFYNMLSECHSIFAHNESDIPYYKGLFPNKEVQSIYSLMIDDYVKDIEPTKEDKAIIGGNFARWYGGFESYIVAQSFNVPIWVQESHAKRENEEFMDGLNHLPRLIWNDWMRELSTYKYAVHLMPTVAAGTFSLNCAYFGIPCIGNIEVDTQRLCHPVLSVDVKNVDRAKSMAGLLVKDKDFYNSCSDLAKRNYEENYSLKAWTERIKKHL